jgi:tetratricopeptide (TPR) repeat protein/transcriptional regulator with XRE-family HTH domain
LGLTQDDLAAATGLSVRSIRNIEAGRVAAPRAPSVRLLAYAFGLDGADRARFCQAAAGEAADQRAPVGTPAQLPAAVAGFTGRAGALKLLDETLPVDGDTAPAPVVITAIAGTAGVGKTALAVHWARRVADRFPDGQLYVNLRGFAPSESPVDPVTVVRGFLEALQVPDARIPAGPDAQVALYRSLLADRRILIVLDDARNAEQVRTLLPGAAGCVVVVTSRDQLSGLAVEGAHLLTLDLLTTTEAHDLLARRLGDDRVAAEPEATQQITTRCARLPLALAIVAARAAAHPRFPLAAVADELRAAESGLDMFASGDRATDLRTVFSCSYRALRPDAARLFRLLGPQPGPDIAAPAVASLAAVPAVQVRPLLAELTDALLLTEDIPGRYACHDLLRAYAGELANTVDTEAERTAARHRLLDHYLHTAHAAALLLWPSRRPVPLTAPQHRTTPQRLGDRQQAEAWFAAEHAVLLAAVTHAADHGFDAHAWQLAWALEDFFDRRGHWRDLASALRVGLAAAVRQGDRAGQAHTHRGLARAYLRQASHDDTRTHLQDTRTHLQDACTHLRQALRWYGELGDRVGQADSTRNLALVLGQQGHHRQALAEAERALALYPAGSHPAGRAQALNGIGWLHSMLGDHRRALRYCQQALALQEEIDDRSGAADTWDSLGCAHHRLGHHDEAIACYQRALDLYRDLDFRYLQAKTLTRLGDTHHAAGHPDRATETWQRAKCILDDLDHPDADLLRAKLRTS